MVKRSTGVIVGMGLNVTEASAESIRSRLEQRFPGVTFAIVPGGQSLAFEFDREDEES